MNSAVGEHGGHGRGDADGGGRGVGKGADGGGRGVGKANSGSNSGGGGPMIGLINLCECKIWKNRIFN